MNELDPTHRKRRARDERGDVPGWVMITVMSAGLVAILSSVAGPRLSLAMILRRTGSARAANALSSRSSAVGSTIIFQLPCQLFALSTG